MLGDATGKRKKKGQHNVLIMAMNVLLLRDVTEFKYR